MLDALETLMNTGVHKHLGGRLSRPPNVLPVAVGYFFFGAAFFAAFFAGAFFAAFLVAMVVVLPCSI
jgi:hypothetical protein